MRLLLTGLSHHTAPVELRERLASCDLDPTRLLTNLRELPAVREAFFLSTCNRFEFLLGLDPAEAEANLADLDQGLARLSQVSPAEMGDCFYRHIEQDAVRHLFRVASSLDSMVVGEPQILGQLKAAYVQASRAGVLGPILNRLMHRGFFVAKRVRTETGVADSAVSIAFAAVELARKIFGLLEGRHALLIGAGEMAELAAEHLLANGASSLTVANRTLANAVKAAQKFDGQAVSLEELDQALLQADIVISSTGATEPVITAKMVKAAMKPRRHRPLFLIDIAVPRDIEEKVGRLENVYLYDIDDLDQVVARNRAKRENEAVRAERIVAEEAIKFQGWLDSLAVVPTIKSLADKLESIRQTEMDKTLRHGEFDQDQIDRLEAMTKAMMKKILHQPAALLKREFRNEQNRTRYLDATRLLFDLNEEENQPN